MKGKILVVDDASTVRLFFRMLLTQRGFEVIEARDGVEGLEAALESLPGLAFVDINMPALDGYALVRRLRAEPSTRVIPVVMCSTENKAVDETQAYQAGANFYVRKPVCKDLVLRLSEVLGRSS